MSSAKCNIICEWGMLDEAENNGEFWHFCHDCFESVSLIKKKN